MTLHFHGEVADADRVALDAAHNATLVASLKDSNDGHIEALNDLVGALMIYAGIEETGDDEPGHCDNCDEVHLVLDDDDLCEECAAEIRVPQVDDWAEHRSGTLDPRRVVEVNEDGTQVRIRLITKSSDWLPAENYTFKENAS